MDNRDGQVDAMETMLEAFKKLNVSSNTSTVFPQLTVFTNAQQHASVTLSIDIVSRSKNLLN